MIERKNKSSSGVFTSKGCRWAAMILLGALIALAAVGVTLAQDMTIAGVSAGDVTGDSAVITWTTGEAADSRVNYGNTTALGTTASSGSFVTDHALTLIALDPSTVYYYEVVSSNRDGDIVVDNNGGAYYTFLTPPEETNLAYLVAAYTIIWIGISAYVFNLRLRVQPRPQAETAAA